MLLDSVKARACKVISAIHLIQNEIRLNNILFRFKTIAMDYYGKATNPNEKDKEMVKIVENFLGKEPIDPENQEFPY